MYDKVYSGQNSSTEELNASKAPKGLTFDWFLNQETMYIYFYFSHSLKQSVLTLLLYEVPGTQSKTMQGHVLMTLNF